jgi:hypothetical protein
MSFHDGKSEEPGEAWVGARSLGDAVRQRASEVSLVRFGLLSRWAQEVGGRRRIRNCVIPEPRRDV